MSLKKILSDIEAERAYQDARWGTEFDDKNTVNDWAAYIGKYTGQAIVDDPAEQRRQLVKVASLAVAAIQTFDRNGGFAARHYDKPVLQA